jgi:arylsulfatase A-like enzyme
MNKSMRLGVGSLVLFAAGWAHTASAAASEAPGQPKQPNILFILTDDQSYKTVRCYPESVPWIRTPNIDALAVSGVRFERAYLGAWCMPSRATLLTGRQPHAIESMRMVGDYPGSTYDPTQCPFWPAEFRKNGYHTAHIGKWHTGVDPGFGRDWDYQIVWNRPKHPDNAGNYYENQLLAFNGQERLVDGYSTDNYTRWACEYIRGEHRDATKPWYLWLCYGGVHGPSHPAKRHQGAYDGQIVTPPADIFPPRPDKPKYLDVTQAWVRGPGGVPVMGRSGEKFGDESAKQPKTHAAWVRQVNECVLSLDEGIGQVLAALKQTGQLENTLVVFSSDQGFSMGEHGFRTKLAPYDANFASPLIVSMPGTLPVGKVCRQPVSAADLVVTFFGFARVALPWSMHGRDISPLLHRPERTDWPHPVLYEHTGHHYGSDVTRVLADGGAAEHSNVPWYVAIRHGRYKYIRTLLAGEVEELYDLEVDPEELRNLATGMGHHDQLARLRGLTLAELRRTEAGFIDHMPATATRDR